MRKTIAISALATLLLAGCNESESVTPAATEATTNVEDTTEAEEQTMETFIAQQGTIESLNQTVDGLFVEMTLDGEPLTFLLFEDTPIVSNTGEDIELQVGMTVQGYMYANSPMVMIYPPRYTPVIVVVETEEMGLYNVASFNDEHINDTNTLQINSEEDMPAGEYAVFYTTSTRSIPAQTTPQRIIALTNPFTETAQ